MIRRRPHRSPLARRSMRIPAACKDVLSGAPAAGKLSGPTAETKLCASCFARLERSGAHLLGDGVTLTRET